jgi:zinc protease
VRENFGAITRSPAPIPQVYTEEPAQTGPRRVVVKRPGEVGVVEVAYKVPPTLHPDQAPLDVLGAILSEGKTSRLYRALIDTNLAISANAGKGFFHDETLFTTTAMLAPGVTHAQVEKTVLAEIERVKQEGVTAAEVSRAINKLLAGIAYQRDGSFAIAGQINEAIAVGDWTVYLTQLENIKRVTPADVQRVARAYANEDQSTTGWFIPQAEPAAAGPAEPSEPKKRAPTGAHFYRDPAGAAAETGTPARPLAREAAAAAAGAPAAGGTALIAPRVDRRTVNGIDVATLKTSIPDVVTIRGVVNAGDVFNGDNSAVADLTAGMLDKGTVAHDKFAVAELLEQAGATMSFGTGSHTLNFSAKCLRKDLALVLGLLAEQLRTPRFDATEFTKLKQQFIGRHKRNMEDTDFRAEGAFTRAIFPAGHPNRQPADEKYLADIESATLEQVKAFHAAHYGPTGARLVAVGDVDESAIEGTITDAFAGWKGGQTLPKADKAPAVAAARTEKINMPGKTSVSIVLGQPSGLRYQDTDYQALNFATSVLGSGFFSARLLDIIRNREGLTYGIGAGLGADTYADGSWSIHGTFAPELLEKGVASTVRELRRFHTDGLSAQELATFKTTLTGSYKVALATTGGLASTLLNALQRGYGPEWVDEFPRRIQALTLAEANAAIKKYVNPDLMVTVLAGSLPAGPAKN